jgi:hypothetical protein
VLEVVALVRATGADAAARHAHSVLAHVLLRRQPRLTLAQRQVHAFGGDVLALREREQLTQQLFGVQRLCAAHPESVTAAVYADIEPRLHQAQILIERPAEVCEPGVVGRAEFEFAPRLGC